MQNEATLQQKAMQDIFALDEAVSQFESFGSQLDLGLPPAEDDSPKSFSDMLEVNPSDEPLEYGENFASEGDDMQDQQTQKFVVDEFAKKIAELPDGNISPEDITGISAVIQMNNHITGDVRSFIQQTIDHAVQAQQQQNVSDAQPNGTVAQDIAKTGAAGAEAGLGDPAAVGDASIPAMDPIDPTAEPSLDANTGDDMGLGLDSDVGDPLAGMDNQLGDVGDPMAEPTGDEGIEGAEGGEDPLADMGGEGDLGGLDDLGGEGEGEAPAGEDAGDETLGGEGEGEAPAGEDAGAEGGDDLDNLLDSDDEGKAGGEATEDNDEDFNFEAIATKARGLMETTETTETTTPTDPNASVDDSATAAGVQEGTEVAETQLNDEGGSEGTDGELEECNFAKTQAKVESIVNAAKLNMAAEKARAVLESYHERRDRESTLAKLESVVNNLKQNVLTESIIKKYGEESKRKAMMESAAAPAKEEPKVDETKSMFESTIAMIDNVLAQSDRRAKADKVIAEFEAANAAPAKPKTDRRVAKVNAVLEGIEAKVQSEQKFKNTLNGILEGVQKSQAVSKAATDLDKQLADIVSQVKNA
jgi:hypothetical protein